jgi:hypothetical protein
MAGLCLWWLTSSFIAIPELLRAAIAFYCLTAGTGHLFLTPVRGSLDRLEYWILSAAVGVGVSPAVFDLAMRFRVDAIVAPLMFVSTGLGLFASGHRAADTRRADRLAMIAVATTVTAIAVVTAWSRVAVLDHGRVGVFGDYDVHDLTYYAAVAGELTHTVPPESPFLSGHPLVYSYYPHLLIATVAKTAQVDLLRFCLTCAWPFFCALSSSIVYLLCRRLGSHTFACVATAFVFVGEGLAGLLGIFRPEWLSSDTIVWSSVFLAPSSTWLYYNTWSPALIVLAVVLYALARIEESPAWVFTCVCSIAVLPQVKVFAFMLVLPAVACAAGVLWRRLPHLAARLLLTGCLSVVASLPWLVPLLLNRQESRSFLTLAPLTLPKRMLFKLGMESATQEWAASHGMATMGHGLALAVAVTLFVVGGLGGRIFGIRSIWRGAMGLDVRPGVGSWTVMAWVVLGACLTPFLMTVEPHPNGVQLYVPGLLFAWVFATDALVGRDNHVRGRWWAVIGLVFAVSALPLWHYAIQSADRSNRSPWVLGHTDDRLIAGILKGTNPGQVVILHDNPGDPSLMSVMAQRRVVIAWSDTVGWADPTESERRAEEVEAFFGGRMNLDQAQALWRRYRITHVLVHPDRDHVDPAVLGYLQLAAAGAESRLYTVPEGQ